MICSIRNNRLLGKGKGEKVGERIRNQSKATPMISISKPTKSNNGEETILLLFISITPQVTLQCMFVILFFIFGRIIKPVFPAF